MEVNQWFKVTIRIKVYQVDSTSEPRWASRCIQASAGQENHKSVKAGL